MGDLSCWNCGYSINDIPLPISRHSQCSHCFNELHCCRLCKNHDPEQTTACFDERAETPVQKENANFCDYFQPAMNVSIANNIQKSSSSKSQLESLFIQRGEEIKPDNNHEIESKEASARQALDDLFK